MKYKIRIPGNSHAQFKIPDSYFISSIYPSGSLDWIERPDSMTIKLGSGIYEFTLSRNRDDDIMDQPLSVQHSDKSAKLLFDGYSVFVIPNGIDLKNTSLEVRDLSGRVIWETSISNVGSDINILLEVKDLSQSGVLIGTLIGQKGEILSTIKFYNNVSSMY